MQLSIFLLLEQREDQQIIWMISSLWRCSKPIVMGWSKSLSIYAKRSISLGYGQDLLENDSNCFPRYTH